VKSEGLIYVVTSVASQLLPACGDQRMYTHLQECIHICKCNPYSDPDSIPDLKRELTDVAGYNVFSKSAISGCKSENCAIQSIANCRRI